MNNVKAKPIHVIPKFLSMDSVAEEMKDISTIPLGLKNKDLSVYTYDFKENFTTLLVARNMKNAIDFAYKIIDEVKSLKDVDVVILDAEEMRRNREISLKDEFEKAKTSIETKIAKNDCKFILCVFIGINKFFTENAVDDTVLHEFMKKTEKSGKVSFVIIDNPAVTEQYLISNNISAFSKKTDYNTSFGYVIKEREATLIKLIEMKDSSSD